MVKLVPESSRFYVPVIKRLSCTMQVHHGVSTPTDLSSLAPSIPFLKITLVRLEGVTGSIELRGGSGGKENIYDKKRRKEKNGGERVYGRQLVRRGSRGKNISKKGSGEDKGVQELQWLDLHICSTHQAASSLANQ